MANIELTDVVDALSRLQVNYTSLVSQFYDIFFNPNAPEYVSIVFVDEKGEEIEVAVPTRVADREYINYGASEERNPNSPKGAIFLDMTTGELYVKNNDNASEDSWVKIIHENDTRSIIKRIQADDAQVDGKASSYPEGTIAVSDYNYHVYITRDGKWKRIDSYATGKITEKFTIPYDAEKYPEGIKSIKIDGYCQNIETMSIFEDGLKLSPSTYTLSVDGNRTDDNNGDYYMPYGDNQTIVFRKPVQFPGEGESVELLVEYFTDLHVTESVAENRIVQYIKTARFYGGSLSPDDFNLNYIDDVENKSMLGVDYDVDDLHVGDYFYITLDHTIMIWNGTGPEREDYKIDGKYNYNESDWNEEWSAKKYMESTQDIYNHVDLDVQKFVNEYQQSAEQIYNEFIQPMTDLYNDTKTMKNEVEINKKNVADNTTLAKNYVSETYKNRNAISQMVDSCRKLESDTAGYADYVKDYVNDFALQSFVNSELNRIESGISTFESNTTAKVENYYNTLDNRITNVVADIETSINNCNTNAQNIRNDLSQQMALDRSTFENYVESHSDLADFNNITGFYNKDNFPIDINGIYKYSTEIKLSAGSTNINIPIVKNCSYYSVDIGEYMESVTRDDTTFTFEITPDKGSIDFSLPDKMKDKDNTKMFSDVVCTVRCYIKNDTSFTPSIDWDYNTISWLGMEPELEPGKSYIIEFISYDMTTTWKAHILGICQPTIDIDTFAVSFTVDTTAMSDADIAEGIPVSDTRMVAIIDGKDFVLDEIQQVDNTRKSVDVTLELERKFLGKNLTDFKIKSTNTDEFYRYYSNISEPVIIQQNSTYNIACNDRQIEKNASQYKYQVLVHSEQIENYLRHGLSEEEFITYYNQHNNEITNPDNYVFVNTLPTGDDIDSSKTYIKNDEKYNYYNYDGMWVSTTRVLPSTPFGEDYTTDEDGQINFNPLSVTGKFNFERERFNVNTREFSATYYYRIYNKEDGFENGALFDFDIDTGVVTDPLVVKSEDNHLTDIKVRYDGIDRYVDPEGSTTNYCLSENGEFDVKSSGKVYLSAETVLPNWNENFPIE